MKTKFYLFVTCVILSSLIGCSSNQKENALLVDNIQKSESYDEGLWNETQEQLEKETGASEKQIDTEMNSAESHEIRKTIDGNELQDNTLLTLAYPTFDDLSNSAMINQLVEDFVKELDNKYNAENSDSLTFDYQIMYQDSQYISIYFDGNVNTGAYPSLFKATLNINVEQATRITLNQVIAVNEELEGIVQNQVNDRLEELGTEMTDSILTTITSLETADRPGSDIQTYFTADQVVIIVGVQHAIGDYIEVKIPLSSIENRIQ